MSAGTSTVGEASEWNLEVVRGRDAGRIYPLAPGATLLGNGSHGDRSLDLGPHESDGPRRMAARQAELICDATGLRLTDLASPGGTFVNRQRLLKDQTRRLQPGDLIQVGNVQLMVVHAPSVAKPPPPIAPATRSSSVAPTAAASARPPARSTPFAAPFVLACGAVCRGWDDFLVVSSQRWSAMCDELTSGRLAAFLTAIQRESLVPAGDPSKTPDDRLDAWLATLPATRPCRPELEVNPARVEVRWVGGGGLTRQTFQLANVGYGLLRTRIRVDPDSATWIRVVSATSDEEFVTADQTPVRLEVAMPESLEDPLVGGLSVESNGGSRRVEVRVVRPPEADEFLVGASRSVTAAGDPFARFADQSRMIQRGVGAGLGILARLLVGVGSTWILATSPTGGGPRLAGPILVFAALGAVLAASLARKPGDRRDILPSAISGGIAGALLAEILVGTSRAIEPLLGSRFATSRLALALLWGTIGALLSLLPGRLRTRQAPSEGSP